MNYSDDWRWPTEKKYLNEELDWKDKERWDALCHYGNTKSSYSGLSANKVDCEHREKFSKLKQQLDILTEQEKPQNTEQEESKVRYWEQKLHQHGSEDTSGTQLKIQLQQIEDKFLRAQDEYHKSKARVALQLEANSHQHIKTKDFYSSNLTRAKETLEGLRTYRSKPRIRLEMEMKPHRDYIDANNKDHTERSEWEALKAKVEPQMKAWVKEQQDLYFKEKDQEEADRKARAAIWKRQTEAKALPEAEREAHYKKFPEDRPVVKALKTVKQAKKATPSNEDICREVLYSIIEQVMAAGTLSASSGLGGCNSVVASPCASQAHEVQDPQSCRA